MQNGCRSHEIRWAKGLPEPQVESLLRTAMNLGIQRPNFIAKPRTSGNANHATKYMEIKSIHPRVQAYNQHPKWSLEQRDTLGQTRAGDSSDAKFHITGGTKRTDDDRGSITAFPRTHPHFQCGKRVSGSLQPSPSSLRRRRPHPPALGKAGGPQDATTVLGEDRGS